MKKVLHVVGGMGRGGAPIFITNNLKYNDNNKVVYDFLCRKNNCAYTDIINNSGGCLYITPDFPRHFIKNYIETKSFFANHAKEYNAIHVHANALIYLLPLKLAKKYGIKIRIIHSHNTKAFNKLYGMIHKINMKKVLNLANTYLACGIKAGEWMYGKEPFEVINNAIELKKFEYNETVRKKIRNTLAINDECILLGHVGRFEIAKNHTFLIDIFNELLKKKPNSKLLLIGTGSQEEIIKNKVKNLQIEESVIFIGSSDKVHEFYQAMDVFVLPSLFEGFPFVLVEAQTSGLPCVISENISNECSVTNLVYRMSLSDSKEEWVNCVIQSSNCINSRLEYAYKMKEKGYDVIDTCKRLADIYCQ